MELIDLTKFHALFDSNGLDEFTFSEAGIEVKPGSGTSNKQMMFAQLACLEFHCTEQQLYDWAERLDDNERIAHEQPHRYFVKNLPHGKQRRYWLVEGLPHGYYIWSHEYSIWRRYNWAHRVERIRTDKLHHFVERLSKDVKEKWKNDNERLKEWGFELGFKPDNIEAPRNWMNWLTLDVWTREQAARLICDSSPRQDEPYEALSMLLDRMPSIETQTPFNWLKWFDANGFLSCAPKRILEWYAEEKAKPVVDDGAGSQDDTELACTNETDNQAKATQQQAEAVGNAGGGIDAQEDSKAYELYKKSLDALNIDLKPLKVEDIFNQVKLTDKKLWNIAYTTFKRDVWPIYSKANNLGKQPGRPRNK